AYQCYQLLRFADHDSILSKDDKNFLKDELQAIDFDISKVQQQEIELRYKLINDVLESCVKKKDVIQKNVSARLDKFFLHPVGGYLIFFAMLFLIFQAIFAWAEWPMNLIDSLFAVMSDG